MTAEAFQWIVLSLLAVIAFFVGKIADDVREIRKVEDWRLKNEIEQSQKLVDLESH
jgi:hypothetical protein